MLFRSLAAHLAPGGLAVVDVVLPSPDELLAWDGRLSLEWTRSDPATGSLVSKLIAARWDNAARTVEVTQLFDALPPDGGPLERTARTDLLRIATAGELTLMAEAAGLTVESIDGGFELEPYDAGAARAVLVARQPG